MLISDPGHARDLLAQLRGAPATSDIVDSLRTSWGGFRRLRDAETTTSPAVVRLAGTITELRNAGIVVHGTTATYQAWALAVARYSFETYQLYAELDGNV